MRESLPARRLPPGLAPWLAPRWPALLLAAIAIISSGLSSAWNPLPGLLIAALLTAAALLIAWRAPARGAKIVPFAAFAYGCYGCALARMWAHTYGTNGTLFYGLVDMYHSPTPFRYLLPQSLAFIVAGVMLFARERSQLPGGTAVRAAIGQLLGTGGELRAVPPLLLLPVIFLWEEFCGQMLWARNLDGFLAAALILAAGAGLVALWPRGAAIAAVAGLLVFGFIGVRGEYRALTDSYVAPVSAFTGALYGAVDVDTGLARLAAGVEGALLIGFACFLVPRLFAGGDAALAYRAQALSQRVNRLTQTRSDATEVAVAELRRIERDLHDGAQARLVAVGMSLRAAEQLMTANPEAALALVAEARETSSRALDDLRGLVRGIYPPVLADRGLADAIRAIALDAPMTVTTEITVAGEPPTPVAAAVYFAVAEALTNVARHADAETAQVSVAHGGGMLRATITDDGHGGADPAAGTGLAGVERRLATFDGILAISSPLGGPTIVVIEVPCLLTNAAAHPGASSPATEPAWQTIT